MNVLNQKWFRGRLVQCALEFNVLLCVWLGRYKDDIARLERDLEEKRTTLNE